MGIRFAVRGTQLKPWYSLGGGTYGTFANITDVPVVTANANAGVFGGSVINLVPASVTKGMVYTGYKNVGALNNNGSFSVLARLVPTVTEAPCTGFGLIEVGCSRGAHGFGYRCAINSSGKPYVQVADEFGNVGTYTGVAVINATINVPFDIMFTWDGSATASAIKVSKDGVEIDTLTAAAGVVTTNRIVATTNSMIVGSITAGPTSGKLNLNELIVWDTQEAHEYSVRTAFWDLPAYDALTSEIPTYVL